MKEEKTQFTSYRRILGFSFLLYIALIIPMSLFHELGHALVCTLEGHSYTIWIDFRGTHLLCQGAVQNNAFFNAIGGIYGLIASGSMIVLWLAIHKFVALLVVGLAYSVDQSAKIILEGFAMSSYASGKFDVFLTLLQLSSVIVLAFLVARKYQAPR